MVDTGSQVTVIDPSLASELGLKSQGRVGLVSVASIVQASATVLGTLEADSKLVERLHYAPAMNGSRQSLPSIRAPALPTHGGLKPLGDGWPCGSQ
jgi:Aspartyl protease